MSTAIGTVLDAIRAALILRANLSGVNVFSGPVSWEEAGVECIALGDARLDEEEMAMGGNRLEEWDVDGEILTQRPWQTTTETTIKAARDRTLALFAEVETHINDTYTGSYPHVTVTAGSLSQQMSTDWRRCWLTFTLHIRNPKNP